MYPQGSAQWSTLFSYKEGHLLLTCKGLDRKKQGLSWNLLGGKIQDGFKEPLEEEEDMRI